MIVFETLEQAIKALNTSNTLLQHFAFSAALTKEIYDTEDSFTSLWMSEQGKIYTPPKNLLDGFRKLFTDPPSKDIYKQTKRNTDELLNTSHKDLKGKRELIECFKAAVNKNKECITDRDTWTLLCNYLRGSDLGSTYYPFLGPERPKQIQFYVGMYGYAEELNTGARRFYKPGD